MVSLYCANCANTIGPTQIQTSTVDLSLSNTKSSNSTPSLGQAASCSCLYVFFTSTTKFCKIQLDQHKFKSARPIYLVHSSTKSSNSTPSLGQPRGQTASPIVSQRRSPCANTIARPTNTNAQPHKYTLVCQDPSLTSVVLC